ncbi:MAG: hypothetical protein C4346_19820, partial [Chloroflexota bacterium]
MREVRVASAQESRCPRLVPRLLLATMLIALGLLARPAAEPAGAEDALAPAAVAEAVSSVLFEAQTLLLTGDAAGSAAKALEAEQLASPLVAAFAPVPDDQAALTQA